MWSSFVSRGLKTHPNYMAWTTLKRCWSGAIGEALMDEIHASKTGRPDYPLLTLLRSLLLGVWYKLSDG